MGTILRKYSVQLVQESSHMYDVSKILNDPEQVVEMVNAVFDLENKTQEHLIIVAVDSKLRCIGLHEVHIGAIDFSIVEIRGIFQRLLLCNAHTFFVVHNHPSGVSDFSGDDIKATEKLLNASKLMGIELRDHLIIGRGEYTTIRAATNLWK